METTDKVCPQCSTAIIGRTDKKFCSDQCRFLFHNSRKRADQGEACIHQINASLRKNRSILKMASPIGKTTLSKKILEHHGFDFQHFTHLYRTQRGNTYHFCYDYGYLLLPEQKVLIVNWQPYMS